MMMALEVDQWLASIASLLLVVKRRVDEALHNYCDEQHYAYSSRIKARESAAEKLETGRVKCLAELDDLFGCSVIIPTLSHEDGVIQRLDAMFSRVSLKERGHTEKNPDQFRFEATRYIGRLRSTSEHDIAATISFEVQIRTAFEHAWSVATHSPAYKSDKADWKLERLAAQMKALVEQLDALAGNYEQSAGPIIEHPCERTECEGYLVDKFQGMLTQGVIPKECEPAKWGLFAKNVVALAKAADWGRFVKLQERVTSIAEAAESEAGALGANKFPRSITLFQFVLGTAMEQQVIKTTFRDSRYHPLINPALEAIFPITRRISQRCDLSAPTME